MQLHGCKRTQDPLHGSHVHTTPSPVFFEIVAHKTQLAFFNIVVKPCESIECMDDMHVQQDKFEPLN